MDKDTQARSQIPLLLQVTLNAKPTLIALAMISIDIGSVITQWATDCLMKSVLIYFCLRSPGNVNVKDVNNRRVPSDHIGVSARQNRHSIGAVGDLRHVETKIAGFKDRRRTVLRVP